MTVLLLRMAGPWQSWGTSSRFVRRNTDRAPSKSGIVGLLAAAQGRRRVDTIEDLAGLRFGVRIDQAGRVERDFQTARPRDGGKPMPLSYRFYLSDAVFLAAVEGDERLLSWLREALRHPRYPLSLGRRSCPPAGRLDQGLRDGGAATVLGSEPWSASPRVRRGHGAATVDLDTIVDCVPDAEGSYLVQDEPVTFDPDRREYTWRSVFTEPVTVSNPDHRPGSSNSVPPQDPHDPFAALGGVD